MASQEMGGMEEWWVAVLATRKVNFLLEGLGFGLFSALWLVAFENLNPELPDVAFQWKSEVGISWWNMILHDGNWFFKKIESLEKSK